MRKEEERLSLPTTISCFSNTLRHNCQQQQQQQRPAISEEEDDDDDKDYRHVKLGPTGRPKSRKTEEATAIDHRITDR